MINLFSDKSQCCGCTACLSTCPKGAISMHTDDYGFNYPVIDTEHCVECKKCVAVCDFKKSSGNKNSAELSVYACHNKNELIHKESSSGGVFFELGKKILQNNGVIYGAVYDQNFNVKHIKAEKISDLEKMKGSKYVQSNITGVFKQVKADLEQGRDVLFSGTGCQCAALKSYLNKDYDNLYIIDIVCHGVPSQKFFDDYLKQLEKKYKSKLISFNFRTKKIKGEIQDIEAIFENGKTYRNYPDLDNYRLFFAKNLSLRPSCYNCKYANTERVGDITIGDFWGLEKSMPDFKSRYGTSLIIISTQKGQKLFEEISDSLEIKESTLQNALQPSLISPVKKTEIADEFMNDYIKNGFDYVCNKYNSGVFIKSLKRKIKNIIK